MIDLNVDYSINPLPRNATFADLNRIHAKQREAAPNSPAALCANSSGPVPTLNTPTHRATTSNRNQSPLLVPTTNSVEHGPSVPFASGGPLLAPSTLTPNYAGAATLASNRVKASNQHQSPLLPPTLNGDEDEPMTPVSNQAKASARKQGPLLLPNMLTMQ